MTHHHFYLMLLQQQVYLQSLTFYVKVEIVFEVAD
jgi:hypothetical protein